MQGQSEKQFMGAATMTPPHPMIPMGYLKIDTPEEGCSDGAVRR